MINTVTALEVFFKDIILEFHGKWNEQGLDRLLTGNNIALNKAFELSHKKNIKREHLICYHFSFQSLQTFDNVFSNLLNKSNFLTDLGEFEYLIVPDNKISKLNGEYKDWKKDLIDLFNLRHRIIHEGSNETIKNKDFKTIVQITVHLPSVLDNYIKKILSISVPKLVFYNFGK